FDREREDMTEFPDSEEAILVGFGENTAIPAGKTVLDFTLPALYAGEASQGQPPLAENLRLYVRGGEHVCVIGRNGAGKTTFLRQVAGELLGRQDIRAAYMPQDYGETVDQSQTPVEFLAKSWEKEELTRVKTYLGSMKYTPEEQEHTIQELSGGQKAKLFFLKMILDGANVLVLDEPTRNFSPLSGPVIRGILEEFPGCILSVSHDRKYIGQVCDTVYQLEPQGLVPLENPWRETAR
ncbi:MAG: ATP-binding cassette domain-containing protein, partial [Acutalibacter sp.]